MFNRLMFFVSQSLDRSKEGAQIREMMEWMHMWKILSLGLLPQVVED